MAIGGDSGSQSPGNQNVGNNVDPGTSGEQKPGETVIPKSGGDNKKDNVDQFANLWDDHKEEEEK